MTQRKIMFRGLRESDRQWVYGYYCTGSNGIHHIIDEKTDSWWTVLPETVGQYTEIIMLDGHMLWGEDLVKVKEIIWVVEFGYDRDKTGLGWVTYPVDNPSVRLFVDKSILSGEIVGSIHTHKELIKQ